MTAPQQPAPQGRPGDRHPDPLAMTPAEKLAAEWEARHDVAARGHVPDPAAVQHYLAESRTREAQRKAGTPAAASVAADQHPAPPAPAQAETAPSPRRRWWPFGRR